MPQEYKHTIDWDEYWKDHGENEEMKEGSKRMADRLSQFIKEFQIYNMADFGCGPARMLFILAEKYPEINFTGYDSAKPIVNDNKRKNELSNLKFKVKSLPNIKVERRYDVVTCIATLHYIKDIESAIANLWEQVNENGFLIFNYPNLFTKYAYQNWEKIDEDDHRKRFKLVLEGENLLTLDEIENIVEKKPKNFWRFVGEESNRANMGVYIQK